MKEHAEAGGTNQQFAVLVDTGADMLSSLASTVPGSCSPC